jgi:hypothetical protein
MTRSPPHKARVIALLRQGGKSLSEIGRECGVTKNVVVGYRKRLLDNGETLPTLAVPASLRAVAEARRGAPWVWRRPAAAAPVSLPPPQPTGVVIPFRAAAEPPHRLLPQHSRPRACRWPLWSNTERPTHRYCDAPRRDAGCSWCAEHAKLVFAGGSMGA